MGERREGGNTCHEKDGGSISHTCSLQQYMYMCMYLRDDATMKGNRKKHCALIRVLLMVNVEFYVSGTLGLDRYCTSPMYTYMYMCMCMYMYMYAMNILTLMALQLRHPYVLVLLIEHTNTVTCISIAIVCMTTESILV